MTFPPRAVFALGRKLDDTAKRSTYLEIACVGIVSEQRTAIDSQAKIEPRNPRRHVEIYQVQTKEGERLYRLRFLRALACGS